jgi:hypothetical protein
MLMQVLPKIGVNVPFSINHAVATTLPAIFLSLQAKFFF